MQNRVDFVTQAIQELYAGLWDTCSSDLNDIRWKDGHTTTPEEVVAISNKADYFESLYEAKSYARSRAAEYPPITDYLDGVVKGDQAQIDAYIAACQAVKAKYPKV